MRRGHKKSIAETKGCANACHLLVLVIAVFNYFMGIYG